MAYTSKEVSSALFEMHLSKAPCIDGFSTLYYHKFWSLTKDGVCGYALEFLNTEGLDQRVNKTQIVLIHKVKVPQLWEIL